MLETGMLETGRNFPWRHRKTLCGDESA